MDIPPVVRTLVKEYSDLLRAKFYKKTRRPTLMASVNAAKLEWQQTLRDFNLVDMDMVDYAIYKINAAERRYMLLLDQVKKDKTAAW